LIVEQWTLVSGSGSSTTFTIRTGHFESRVHVSTDSKMEKDPNYRVGVGMANGSESPDYHVDQANKMEARRGSKINEATDMYGDVATAEEYGYVARG
jgi:hypothetical protein